jgi:hypothetical protein
MSKAIRVASSSAAAVGFSREACYNRPGSGADGRNAVRDFRKKTSITSVARA